MLPAQNSIGVPNMPSVCFQMRRTPKNGKSKDDVNFLLFITNTFFVRSAGFLCGNYLLIQSKHKVVPTYKRLCPIKTSRMLYNLTQFRRLWHWSKVKSALTWGQIWRWHFEFNVNIILSAFAKETQRDKHLSCSYIRSEVISGNPKPSIQSLTFGDLWSLNCWP